MAISDDGAHAVTWYDHAAAKPGDPVGNFQAISVLRLTPGKQAAFDVSVGFKPSGVQFTEDGKQAMVVTEDGISVLQLDKLSAGQIIAAVPLSPTPLEKPVGREVQITADGTWAVLRQQGLKGIRAVHLPSKTLVQLAMHSVPTDVDLLPDGSAALVTLRESSRVAMVALPAAATKTLVAEEVFMKGFISGLARISDDGKTALLYSTVSGVEQVGIMDLKSLSIQPILIRKTVDFVFIPKGSRKAVLVHRPADGPTAADTTEKFVDDSHGYTFIDLDSAFTKLVLTPVQATGIALSHKPPKLFMLLPDPKAVNHGVHVASVDTFLSETLHLGSRPEFIRFLEGAKMMAVTQAHPAGRITFVQVESGDAKTVTGYELNSRVK